MKSSRKVKVCTCSAVFLLSKEKAPVWQHSSTLNVLLTDRALISSSFPIPGFFSRVRSLGRIHFFISLSRAHVLTTCNVGLESNETLTNKWSKKWAVCDPTCWSPARLVFSLLLWSSQSSSSILVAARWCIWVSVCASCHQSTISSTKSHFDCYGLASESLSPPASLVVVSWILIKGRRR